MDNFESDLERALAASLAETAPPPPSDEEEMMRRAIEASLAAPPTHPPTVSHVNSDEELRRAMEASLAEAEQRPGLRRVTSEEATARALAASLASHEAEQKTERYRSRAQEIEKALGRVPFGRERQCLEMPKNSGLHFVNCLIFFLARKHRSRSFVSRKVTSTCPRYVDSRWR